MSNIYRVSLHLKSREPQVSNWTLYEFELRDRQISYVDNLNQGKIIMLDEQTTLKVLNPSEVEGRSFGFAIVLRDEKIIFEALSKAMRLETLKMITIAITNPNWTLKEAAKTKFLPDAFRCTLEKRSSDYGSAFIWIKRDFVLKSQRLSYFDGSKLKGIFTLNADHVIKSIPLSEETSNKPYAFSITSATDSLYLSAADEETRKECITYFSVAQYNPRWTEDNIPKSLTATLTETVAVDVEANNEYKDISGDKVIVEIFRPEKEKEMSVSTIGRTDTNNVNTNEFGDENVLETQIFSPENLNSKKQTPSRNSSGKQNTSQVFNVQKSVSEKRTIIENIKGYQNDDSQSRIERKDIVVNKTVSGKDNTNASVILISEIVSDMQDIRIVASNCTVTREKIDDEIQTSIKLQSTVECVDENICGEVDENKYIHVNGNGVKHDKSAGIEHLQTDCEVSEVEETETMVVEDNNKAEESSEDVKKGEGNIVAMLSSSVEEAIITSIKDTVMGGVEVTVLTEANSKISIKQANVRGLKIEEVKTDVVNVSPVNTAGNNSNKSKGKIKGKGINIARLRLLNTDTCDTLTAVLLIQSLFRCCIQWKRYNKILLNKIPRLISLSHIKLSNSTNQPTKSGLASVRMYITGVNISSEPPARIDTPAKKKVQNPRKSVSSRAITQPSQVPSNVHSPCNMDLTSNCFLWIIPGEQSVEKGYAAGVTCSSLIVITFVDKFDCIGQFAVDLSKHPSIFTRNNHSITVSIPIGEYNYPVLLSQNIIINPSSSPSPGHNNKPITLIPDKKSTLTVTLEVNNRFYNSFTHMWKLSERVLSNSFKRRFLILTNGQLQYSDDEYDLLNIKHQIACSDVTELTQETDKTTGETVLKLSYKPHGRMENFWLLKWDDERNTASKDQWKAVLYRNCTQLNDPALDIYRSTYRIVESSSSSPSAAVSTLPMRKRLINLTR